MEIINITVEKIGGTEINSVNARELWEYLESKQEFASWIKNRIEKYGFIEGEDFLINLSKTYNEQGGRPKTDYIITLDMAKELAMVENNEKGREIRKYFIEKEKEAKSGKRRTLTKEELRSLELKNIKSEIDTQLKMYKKEVVAEKYREYFGITDELLEKVELENEHLKPVAGFHYDSNVVEFANKCIVRKDKSYVTVEKLYKRYIDYCKDEGLKPLSKIVFGKEVKKITDLDSEVKRIEGKNERVYLGIAI